MPGWQTRLGRQPRDVAAVEHDLARRSAGLNPEITSKSVVLPAPLGPPMPRISPGMTSKLRSLTAASAPKFWRRHLAGQQRACSGQSVRRHAYALIQGGITNSAVS